MWLEFHDDEIPNLSYFVSFPTHVLDCVSFPSYGYSTIKMMLMEERKGEGKRGELDVTLGHEDMG